MYLAQSAGVSAAQVDPGDAGLVNPGKALGLALGVGEGVGAGVAGVTQAVQSALGTFPPVQIKPQDVGHAQVTGSGVLPSPQGQQVPSPGHPEPPAIHWQEQGSKTCPLGQIKSHVSPTHVGTPPPTGA